jgi:hypothetical protein
MKRLNESISKSNENITTEKILNATEQKYYIFIYGIDYRYNKEYIKLINKTNLKDI